MDEIFLMAPLSNPLMTTNIDAEDGKACLGKRKGCAGIEGNGSSAIL